MGTLYDVLLSLHTSTYLRSLHRRSLSVLLRVEMSRRAADRAQDEAAHRKLLRQNYVESQARHAYRLANPAYADGRIW